MSLKFLKTTAFTVITLTSVSSSAEELDSFGLSLGSPAALNFVYKSEKLGIPLQISGGYWGDKVSGVEVGYNFYKNNDSIFRSAQVITGYSVIEKNRFDNHRWTYVGVLTTFKKGGFFFEPGLTFGSGTYSNPQLMLQVGWLWDL